MPTEPTDDRATVTSFAPLSDADAGALDRLLAELADLVTEVRAALADGKLTIGEALAVGRELADVAWAVAALFHRGERRKVGDRWRLLRRNVGATASPR